MPFEPNEHDDVELTEQETAEIERAERLQAEFDAHFADEGAREDTDDDADDNENDNTEILEQGHIEPDAPDPNEYQQASLFATERLPEIRGKSLEALAYSRQVRDDLVRLFKNSVPESVMLADKASRDEHDLATGTYEESGQLAQKRARGEHVAKVPKTFEVSGRGAASGALSKFPQNIGRACVLLYSNPGDTIVDPFAGHNSRMDLCVKEGRHYVGQDLSKKFHAFNVERAKELRLIYPEINIELYQGTSEKMFAKDMQGDMTITSPPYYDIEEYGDEPEQLGKRGTYQQFMHALQTVSDENFRTLKDGAFCAWFINDFRRKGEFIAFHVDVMHMLKQSGFVMWDIMITDFGRTFRSVFVNQIMQQKILPKRHEYGIIVRKPGWKKTKVTKDA